MKFTINDIKDIATLNREINEEAKRIFSSDKARRDRTYEQVLAAVKQGKIAERYLIEAYGFLRCDLPYHDLETSNGYIVEVKAYSSNDPLSEYVLKDLERIRREKWNKSHWYFLFSCLNGEYTLLQKIKIRNK